MICMIGFINRGCVFEAIKRGFNHISNDIIICNEKHI